MHGRVWTWQRSTSRSGGSWTEISGASSRDYTPVVDDEDHYLRATVTYHDNADHFTVRKTVQTVSEFTTAAARTTNAAPVLPAAVAAVELPENARPGTNVGSPVQATDTDNDPINYSLSGAREFVVDRVTGQIKVAPGAALDFEGGTTSYTLTVTAADGFGDSATVMAPVTITDVPEPPVAVDDAYQGYEDEALKIDPLANDRDPEDGLDTLTLSVVRPPAWGTLVMNAPVNAGDRPTITYTTQLNSTSTEPTASATGSVTPVASPPMWRPSC